MRKFVEDLKRHRFYAPQVAYHQYFSSQEARVAQPKQPLPPALDEILKRQGIRSLYSHQAAALEKIGQGKNVVIATPTASGKTLTYNLPVLEGVLRDPEAKALYIFPLKALEQDQRKALLEFTSSLTGANEGTGRDLRRRHLQLPPPEDAGDPFRRL